LDGDIEACKAEIIRMYVAQPWRAYGQLRHGLIRADLKAALRCISDETLHELAWVAKAQRESDLRDRAQALADIIRSPK
jgi:hypothetical protein